MTSHSLRGFSPQSQWHDARRRYEATLDGLAARMAAIAFDDFERLCGEPPPANVPSMVDGFIEALRREGVDRKSLSIYREAVEGVVAWASKQLRSAA